jgi:hypothetical protein
MWDIDEAGALAVNDEEREILVAAINLLKTFMNRVR